MTATERDRPAANRAASEIEFVLRRAKWRRGSEVLRDVARAQGAADEAAEREPKHITERRKGARAKKGA